MLREFIRETKLFFTEGYEIIKIIWSALKQVWDDIQPDYPRKK